MFRIVVPFCNAGPYLGRCIESLKDQTYKDWHCYLCDDCSTDNSVEVAAAAIGNTELLFTLQQNSSKLYVPGNYVRTLAREEIADEDVIICLDGDDRLSDAGALARVARAYANPKVWLTWGSYMMLSGAQAGRRGISTRVQNVVDCRTKPWRFSHLRTFKAWLFRQINPLDLRSPTTGNYWETAGDMAIMFPMLEMATNGHAQYLFPVNYIYNDENPACDHRLRREQQLEYELLLRKMPPYPPVRR